MPAPTLTIRSAPPKPVAETPWAPTRLEKLENALHHAFRITATVWHDREAESWLALNARLTRMTQGRQTGAGVASDAFIRRLEAATDSRLVGGNRVALHVDGAQALRARDEAIASAQHSIDLMTWAVYDDAEGTRTTDLLIRRHAEGIAVRVLVDANVAHSARFQHNLRRLRAAGITVVTPRDAEHYGVGQHRKVLSIDGGRQVIAGGRNPGAPYYRDWHDVDAALQGPVCEQYQQMLNAAFGDAPVTPRPTRPDTALERAMMIEHVPGRAPDTRYLEAVLLAIEAAKTSVYIENAYIVQTPALRDALIRAQRRGVDVRVMTNSTTSVDEPAVAVPCARAMRELRAAGIPVYLRQGSTLHSKVMTVDGQLAIVGSYNLHQRSHYYEHEIATLVIGDTTAPALQQQILADMAAAYRPATPADIALPDDAKARIEDFVVEHLFMRQV